MLVKLLFAAMVLAASPALAQQSAPDSRLATYRNLLSEANDRLVSVTAQAEAQIAVLRKEIDELKAKAGKPPEPKK